jgi:peptidoglycan hydrolase CwlO-like protein
VKTDISSVLDQYEEISEKRKELSTGYKQKRHENKILRKEVSEIKQNRS